MRFASFEVGAAISKSTCAQGTVLCVSQSPPSSSRFTRPATPSRLSFHLSKIFTQLDVLTLLSGVPPAGCSVTARMSHR